MTAVIAVPAVSSRFSDNENSKPIDTVSKAPVAIVTPPPEKNETENKKETIRKSDENIRFIVELNAEPLIDTVIHSGGKYKNLPELLLSGDSKSILDTMKKNQAVVKASIQKLISKSDFSESHTYCAVFNGFSVKAPSSAKEKIEKINGVKKVYSDNTILYQQSISDIIADTENISRQQLQLLNDSADFDGQNTLITVIDTEFDITHNAFSVQPTVTKYDSDTVKNIFNTVNFAVGKDCQFEDVFQSSKILYAYDYGDDDTDTKENFSHGTPVAALAGGNDEENHFQGVAYNAQLAFMKVCSRDGLVHTDRFLAALDDSAKLGSDIINISLGNEDISDIFQTPLDKLAQTGTVIVCPCGNDGYREKIHSYDTDYGTLSCISGYDSVISVASSTNPLISAHYVTADGNDFLYSDVGEELKFTELPYENRDYIFLEKADNGEYDFSPAENKIAVIETALSEIQHHAQQAYFAGVSALAVIDSGNFENDRHVSIETKNIPVIIIDDNYTDYFSEYTEGIFDIPENPYLTDTVKGNTISDFSSWGVTPDLRLKPEITSLGENVFSADSDGSYSYLSGTSFSSALVSGTYAVIFQYLKQYEWFHELSPAEQAKTVTCFIMSNAEPVKQYDYEADELLYLSPRKQGAGRADIESVIQSGAYLFTENGLPKASIHNIADNKFQFSFSVRNISAETLIFSVSHYISADKCEIADDGIINTRQPYSLKDSAQVKFFLDGEEITEIELAENQQTDISVSVELHADELKENFPNGFFTDGYIVLENQNGRTLNFPFTAFIGEWGNINPFYEEIKTGGNHLVSVDYNADSEPVTINGYMSKNMTGNFYEIAQMKNSYILPNFRLMRDVYDFTVTVSDNDGKFLFSKNFGTVSRNSGELYRNLIGDSRDIAEFFSNLPDSEYIYTVTAKTMTAQGTLSGDIYSVTYPFCMDSQKPDMLSSRTYQKDGKIYLQLTAKDNRHINGFEIYTAAYNSNTRKYEYADKLDDLKEAGYLPENAYTLTDISEHSEGSVTYTYDITDLHDELIKLQFMTRTSISPFSPLRIAYRAYDGAYNSTGIKIADAVVYKRAVFRFTDQNGKPAENIKVSLGNKTVVSDKNGMASFEGLLSDIYLVQILSLPDEYSCKEKFFIAQIESTDYQQEISVHFSGEYPEISEEESSIPEISHPGTSAEEPSEIDGDSPLYAIIFVGILVIISSVAFAVNRKMRK